MPQRQVARELGISRNTVKRYLADDVEPGVRVLQEEERGLAGCGVRMGLPRDVTTPAGCTIAGLLTMEDGRIRSTLARTIEEATRTASGLSAKPRNADLAP